MINHDKYVHLEGSLIGMKHDMEKIRCMMEHLCEYFSIQNVKTDSEKQYNVIFQHAEMRVLAEITFDYTSKLDGELTSMWELIEEIRPVITK